ncbi:MAG: hypothetical protein GY708_25965, partial [Actinomycetia bacterium]|nr:hypothetical protein [Actinomycetes bacterium]
MNDAVGSAIDPLEVDAPIVADALHAIAYNDLYLTDVAGSVTIKSLTSDVGDIGFTVTDGDNAGEDFTIAAGKVIEATAGSVALTVGDDFVLAGGGFLIAGAGVSIAVDQEGLDHLTGSTIDLLGTLTVGTTLTLTGGPDDDTINMPKPTAATLTIINSGDGSDTITIGNAPIDDLGAVRVDAGTGDVDTLTIDDSGDTNGNAPGGLYPASVAGYDGKITGFDLDGAIHYAGLDALTLNLGVADDVVTVTSTADTTVTTIRTGAGTDAVTVGHGADGLDRILGKLNLEGAADTDTLTVSDGPDDSNDVGLLTPSSLTGLGMGASSEGIGYGGFEAVSLTLGAGDNKLTIAGVHTTTDVVSGSGDDDFIIREANLSGITQALTITGQAADSDEIFVDLTESANMEIGVGAISDATMTGSIRYSGMDQLTLDLGNNPDTVTIDNSGVPVILNATGGADLIYVNHLAEDSTFNLGSDGSKDEVWVYSADAALTVIGGAGDPDALTVDLSATSGGVNGSLVDHAVDDDTGLLGGVLGDMLTFTDLATFSLTLGSDNDVMTVNTDQYQHLTNTVLRLDGGASADNFNISSLGDTTVVGGGDGEDTALIVIATPPNGFPTANQYTDLRLDIETLVVDNHTSSQATAWVLRDGILTADKIPAEGPIAVTSSEGAGLVRILGGTPSADTLEVATDNSANVIGSVYRLEGNNRIELAYGTIVLDAGEASTFARSQVLIDFDHLVTGATSHDEDRMRLSTSTGGSFVRDDVGSPSLRAAASSDQITLATLTGDGFGIYSMQLANSDSTAHTVTFTGTTLNGQIVQPLPSISVPANSPLTTFTAPFGDFTQVLQSLTWSMDPHVRVDSIVAMDRVESVLRFDDMGVNLYSYQEAGINLSVSGYGMDGAGGGLRQGASQAWVTATPQQGGPFSLESMQVMHIGSSGQRSITAVGTTATGETVTETADSAGGEGFSTAHFDNMQDMVSIRWSAGADSIIIDDIVFSTGMVTNGAADTNR